MLGVYVVRTEKAEDRQRIQGEVDWRSGGQTVNRRVQDHNTGTRGQEIERTKGYILGGGPEHNTRNPSTSEHQTDSVNSNLVFAPDSQTEDFMIQQALALSSREVAEQENRALLSPEKSPPTFSHSTSSRSLAGSKQGTRGRQKSGKKSSTATKSKEEEELELAIKLSLENATESKDSEDVPVFDRGVGNSVVEANASDSMGTENTVIPLEPNLDMDSQEEFQYVLELSRKTATGKGNSSNESTNCDDLKQLETKKPALPSLNKATFKYQKSRNSETNVNESKQDSSNSDDEELKRALELSLQEDQHFRNKKSSATQSHNCVNDSSIEKSWRGPALRDSDQSDKELELALQLSLQSNNNCAIQSEKGEGIPSSAVDVIEIKDSQELIDDHLESVKSTLTMNLPKDGKPSENTSFPPHCIVLNDSQEEDMGQAVMQSDPGKVKETELKTDDCLVPDSQTEDVQNKEDGTSMAVPETILEDAISTSPPLQSYDSTLEPESFHISPVNSNDTNKCSVAKTSINAEMVESVNVGNDDLDIIPPSPTTSQKSASKAPKQTESLLNRKNVKDDIIIKDKLLADKENANLSPCSDVCSDEYDEYCDNLVLPPLSSSSQDIALPDKALSVKTKSTISCSSQTVEDVLYNIDPVKIKQEKVDTCTGSSITNEEIVMDSQTLEDSQDELPQYDWMRTSPLKTDQITVKVVTPSKMGDNSTSNVVKGISLSQGSTSSININIKIEHIDKTSESSVGIHKKNLIDDEEYARHLQRELDEEYELSKHSSPSKVEARPFKQEVFSPQKPECKHTKKFEDLDAVIAQSLHEEINSPGPKLDKHLLMQDEEFAKQLNEELNKPSRSGKLIAVLDVKGVGEELDAVDLVEKNQEERRRQIQIDEDLARQLLESKDNYTSTGMKGSSATKRKGLLINDSPPSAKHPRHETWRKNLFNEDRLSKEKSSFQLQEIRKEQSEKFLRDKCGSSSDRSSTSFRRSPWIPDVKTERTEDRNKMFWDPPSSSSSPWNSKSSSTGPFSSQCPSSSQYPSSNQRSTNSLGQDEDEKTVMGTQSKALSKSKCGNCGEIGHNRKWVKCPRYYSHEECLRREEQQTKARERVEAREREETQARQDLEQHHRALKDIATQIEQEQKGLERTIKRLDK